MRRFLVLFFLLLSFCFLGGMISGAAHAQSVLVPQDDIAVISPEDEGEKPVPPIVNRESSYGEPEESSSNEEEASSGTNGALPPSISSSVLSRGNTRSKMSLPAANEDVSAAYRRMPEKEYAPFFIDENIMLNKSTVPTSRSLTVSLSEKYRLTIMDAHMIKNALGYDPADVAKKCRLRVNVELETSDEENDSYQGYVTAGQQENIPYNGTLRSITLRSQALCTPPSAPLPKRPTILMRSGDDYGVFLAGQGTCAFGNNADVSSVFISAGDNETIACFRK